MLIGSTNGDICTLTEVCAISTVYGVGQLCVIRQIEQVMASSRSVAQGRPIASRGLPGSLLPAPAQDARAGVSGSPNLRIHYSSFYQSPLGTISE
jgi:hypothetical protein